MAFKAGAIFGEAILETSKWDRGLKSIAKGATIALAAAGAAFFVFGVKASKSANEFQKEMANVNTLIDETVTSTADLTKQLLSLDPRLGKTTDLTKGLYQAFSAGASDATEAMQITTDAAIFSGAALTDMSASVDVLTTATNAYGKEIVNSTQASDIFFTTIKQGKLTGEQLSSTIGQSIPLFASAKIKLEELSSGIAAMTKQGINAAESTTQLNAIVNAFLKPSEELANKITELGFASGSAFLEAKGLSGALDLIQNATKGDAAEIAKLLPNIRAMRGAMALTGVGGKEFSSILKEMEKSSGATKEAFDKQEKTWETFTNQINKFEIVAGNVIKFFVDDVVVGLTQVTKGVTDFLISAEGMNVIGNIVSFVAGAFNALKTFAEPLISVIGPGIKEIVSAWKKEFSEMGNETDILNTLLKAFSIQIHISALALGLIFDASKVVISNFNELTKTIVSGSKWIATAFDLLRGKASLEDLRESYSEFTDSFGELTSGVVDSATDLRENLVSRWNDLKQNAEDTAEKTKAAFVQSSEDAKNDVISNWDEMFTGQKDMTNKMVANVEDTGDEINQEIKSLAAKNNAEWKKHWDKVLSGINQFVTMGLDVISFGLDSWSSIMTLQLDNQEQMIEQSFMERMEPIQEAFDLEMELLLEREEMLEESLDNEISLLTDSKDQRLFLLDEEKDAIELKFIQDLERLKAENLSEKAFNAKKRILTEQRTKDLKLNSLEQSRISREASQEKKRIEDLETANIAKNKSEQNRIEKAFNDKKTQLEAQKNAELNDAARKQFETQKSLDIARVWTSAASSIMGWWAQAPLLGPFAGPIFGGIMTAATLGVAGVQSALISQQQFVPAFQDGGTASGISRINEAGGEILNLPDGTVVVPNDISRQIAAASGNNQNITINNSFAGAKISSELDLARIADEVGKRISFNLRFAQ